MNSNSKDNRPSLEQTIKNDEGRAEILINNLKRQVNEGQSIPIAPGKVLVDKAEMLILLSNLSDVMKSELKTYREVTDRKAKIINDAKEEAKGILSDAERGASRIRVSKRRPEEAYGFNAGDLSAEDRETLRTASDIYAASLIYTDEMLTEVDHLINNAYDTIEQEFERVRKTLKAKINSVTENKAELVNNLNELSVDDRYSQILEISQLLANELYIEREKAKLAERERKLKAEEELRKRLEAEAMAKNKGENQQADKGENIGIRTMKSDKQPINPDRTAKKLDVKKNNGMDIKVKPRNAESSKPEGGSSNKKKLVIDDSALDANENNSTNSTNPNE